MTKTERLLLYCIRKLQEEQKEDTKILMKFVDFEKSYPHIGNLMICTLSSGEMLIVYREDKGEKVNAG